jgi:hypothetical protein
MPTYSVQIVYRGHLDDPSQYPARLELVVLSAPDAETATRIATELAKRRQLEGVVELPQGDGSLEFIGLRRVDEVDLAPPPLPVAVASWDLEPDTREQLRALVDGGFARAVLDW